jgi:flagellum-specific peptidoglycan hydrolase FlgJ
LLITAILLIVFLYKYTFEKKQLLLKEWILIWVGVTICLFSIFLINTAGVVNERLATQIKVPKDFYTTMDTENDSIISDAILYSHLSAMRVSHAKIILIQAKLESNNYSSDLYKRNHNLFGMKISTSRVTTAGYGRGGYKEYLSWRESVTDYVLWQLTNKVDNLSETEYINFLGKIYAEDPNYTQKIRKYLHDLDFTKFQD